MGSMLHVLQEYPKRSSKGRIILNNLEAATLDVNGKPKFAPMKSAQDKKQTAQLKLFVSKQDMVIEEIKKLDTTRISPIDALNKLDELKKESLRMIANYNLKIFKATLIYDGYYSFMTLH